MRSDASTKELMARMGHDDMRAALTYQRATSEADQQIAERLSELVDEHRGEPDESEDDSSAETDWDPMLLDAAEAPPSPRHDDGPGGAL